RGGPAEAVEPNPPGPVVRNIPSTPLALRGSADPGNKSLCHRANGAHRHLFALRGLAARALAPPVTVTSARAASISPQFARTRCAPRCLCFGVLRGCAFEP